MEISTFPEMQFECMKPPLLETKIQMQSLDAEEQPQRRAERILIKISQGAEGDLVHVPAAVEEDKLQSAWQLKKEIDCT